jgi:hypothetical protein
LRFKAEHASSMLREEPASEELALDEVVKEPVLEETPIADVDSALEDALAEIDASVEEATGETPADAAEEVTSKDDSTASDWPTEDDIKVRNKKHQIFSLLMKLFKITHSLYYNFKPDSRS